MKLMLIAMLLASGATGVLAAPPAAPPPTDSTNVLLIISEGGARFSKTNAVWRRQVRAADATMYIECELLTASFMTNSPRAGTTRIVKDEAPRVEEADADSRLDTIIAETNVMIITPQAQIIGDRAVYSASNDVLIVTGDLVIAVDKRGSFVTKRVIFDLRTESFEVDGTNMFISAPGALSRTNTPSALRKTNAPPAQTPPTAPRKQ